MRDFSRARTAWNAAEATFEEAKAAADATYQEADAAARAVRDKTQDAAKKARSAFEMTRDAIYAETEEKYMTIFAAGRDLSGFRRENILKMAVAERGLCPE